MWTEGKIGDYTYCMKRYEVGSQFGINGDAQISKLEIRKEGRIYYYFDRCLDFAELDADGKEVYEKLLELYK